MPGVFFVWMCTGCPAVGIWGWAQVPTPASLGAVGIVGDAERVFLLAKIQEVPRHRSPGKPGFMADWLLTLGRNLSAIKTALIIKILNFFGSAFKTGNAFCHVFFPKFLADCYNFFGFFFGTVDYVHHIKLRPNCIAKPWI